MLDAVAAATTPDEANAAGAGLQGVENAFAEYVGLVRSSLGLPPVPEATAAIW